MEEGRKKGLGEGTKAKLLYGGSTGVEWKIKLASQKRFSGWKHNQQMNMVKKGFQKANPFALWLTFGNVIYHPLPRMVGF